MITTKEVLQTKGGKEYIIESLEKDVYEKMYEHLNTIKGMKMNSDRIATVTEFKKQYGFHPENIIAIGDNSGITNIFLKPLIPYYGKKGYHCYVKPELSEYLIIHEDPLCSWNCLLNKMNNPKFMVIYTKQL